MIVNKVFCKLASFVKGAEFRLDPEVPDSYLLYLASDYAFRLIRGAFRLRALALVGRRVDLICRTHIKFGRALNVGDDCVINALSIDGVVIGDHVSIQKRTVIECTGSLRFIGRGLKLGDNVGIGSNSFLGCAGGIEIGSDTILGNFVSLHAENHNYTQLDVPIRSQGVSRVGIKIGRDCWIGAKVTILDGAVIEDGCIIAAGALVTSGIYKAHSIYGGVPAKLLRNRFVQ
ncbi:acyltransferase [Pseudomonas urmiensis]|uniref:acyltransferase n=1 Tax=Pseudomonas urmiensis TaxID=2745493 RepID=UPI003D0E10A1